MAHYKYHPNSIISLGSPLDPRVPSDDKSKLDYIESEAINDSNQLLGAEVTFALEQVNSHKELIEKLSLDVNVEAKFGLTNIKGSLSWEKELSFDATAITFIFYGTKIYLEQDIKGKVRLSKSGIEFWKKTLKSNKANKIKNILKFQTAVGTEVVTSIRRGNLISLVYNFNCSSTEQKEQITASINAKWNTGSFDSNFTKELYQLDSSLQIRTKGFQTGISKSDLDIPTLADVIDTNPTDIGTIKKIIKDTLNNVSEENRRSSPVMEYFTTQVSDIKEIVESDFYYDYVKLSNLNSTINQHCVELNELLFNALYLSKELNTLKSEWNKVDFKANSSEIIDNKLLEIKTFIADIGKNYAKAISAESESDLVSIIKYPEPISYSDVINEPFVVPLKWNIETPPAIQDFFDAWSGTIKTIFYPQIYLKYPSALKDIFLKQNGVRIKHFDRQAIKEILKNGGNFKGFWESVRPSRIEGVPWIVGNIEPLRLQKNKEHIQIEGNIVYHLLVVLKDGTSHEVNIGNAAKPIVEIEPYFDHVPLNLIAKAIKDMPNHTYLKGM
jgi:hypothetical protein